MSDRPATRAEIEQFAIDLTDRCANHEQWLSVINFGLGTFLENQPLMIEVIVREAQRQLERKNLPSLTIADEVRFIFQELNLSFTLKPSTF